jgi:hypothetical protein
MAFTPQIQSIASGAAGVYMLTIDESQTQQYTADSKLRLFITNIPRGRVNSVATFAKGDFTSFKKEFGDINPSAERKGNSSIRQCLIALEAGPIAVLNLRSFDDALDVIGRAHV